MSRAFVTFVSDSKSCKEDVMSCAEYKMVEIEESDSEQHGQARRPKPFVVPNGQARSDDRVALLVAKVLDYELAHGSMPT